jgi:hypothetical protein
MNTYTAVLAIPEMAIVLIVISTIVWVTWAVQEYKRAIAKDLLDQAWHEVLDDPRYIERRHFEERKRVEDYDHKHATAA